MPAIRADGIAVYVYRKSASAATSLAWKRKAEKTLPTTRPRPRYEFLQLLRSAKTGEYQHSWQPVYGGVKKRETAVHAALRELKEETGLMPVRMFQVEYLESFYFMPHDYVLVMPVFAVEVSRDAEIRLNHEHTAHRWVTESQIRKAFMWRTQREALQYLLDILHHGSAAMEFLKVDLPVLGKTR